MIVTLVIILGCMLMAGFYSGFETGVYCLSRIRLRYRVREGWKSAELVDVLLKTPARVITTALVGTNVFVFLATLMLTHRLQESLTRHSELVATLILALPLLIFADVIPKDLFRRGADVLVYGLVRPFMLSARLLRPLTVPLELVNRGLLRLTRPGRSEQLYSPARLRHFFEESRTEGVLSAYQGTMADNIMKLREVRAEKVCVPMGSVITLPVDATFEQVRALAEKFPHRRYPVAEPSSGKILGVVNVLDLLQEKSETFRLTSHLREPVRISAGTNVVDALRLLRHASVPLGLVTDESDRTIGVLTAKDLVEEIVGELGVW